MATINFIGGEKGGVGKSFAARLLAQYFIDNNQAFHGFDSDQSHASFSRFYGNFSQSIDITSYDSLDQIINFAERQPEQHIIIDLAAQTARHLDQWIQESDAFGLLQELGFNTYVWQVMDDGVDSLSLLSKVIDKLENQPAQLVVVENHGRGDDFSLTEQAHSFLAARSRGVNVLTIHSLHKSLAQKVDFSNASFWAAANNRELMSLVQRNRVKTWLNKHYVQFDQILNAY